MASPPPAAAAPPPSSSSSSASPAARSSLLPLFDKLVTPSGLAMVPSLLASEQHPDPMSIEGIQIPASPPSPVAVSRPRISLLADEKHAKQPRILRLDAGADIARTSSPICAGSPSPTFPLTQLSTSLPSSFRARDDSEESEYEKFLPMTPPDRVFSCSRDVLAAPMAPRKAYKIRAARLRRHQPRRLQFGDDEAVHDPQPSGLSNTPAASGMLAVAKKSSAPSYIEDACRGIAPLEIADNVGEPIAFQRDDESSSESPQTPPAARFDSFACGNTPRAPKKLFGGSRLERD